MKRINNFYTEDKHLQEIVKQYTPLEMLDWAIRELEAFGAMLCNGY